ncbi:unnamed protein product [Owenia fusiformis]|uniref:Uncharacterized protein n=1 Tax=Owenia fusiformis TaxID=6347 RepID=A0A8S4PBQ3_OWEFU|nr:unnamed protein product [Owenia fusiformis]
MKNIYKALSVLLVLALTMQASAARLRNRHNYLDSNAKKLAKRISSQEMTLEDLRQEVKNQGVDANPSDQIDEDDKPEFSWNQMKLLLEIFFVNTINENGQEQD